MEYHRRKFGIEPHIYDDPPGLYFHILLDVADNDPLRVPLLRKQPMLTVFAARDRQAATTHAQAGT